ncbi:MAG: DNRLRE domain-containing protein [Bacteroidetes bacterium]|nr:DNRLRE domain-containing protein [Bacteroidota bacterium]
MKKKLYLTACIMLALMLSFTWQANAQYSVTYKPNATVGEDVDVLNSYGCTPSNASAPLETYNFDGYEIAYTEWTIYALGCSTLTSKALIRFTEMNNLPCNANITYAELRFYGVPSSGFAPQGNSSYPGSPYGTTNPGWVERVTSGWTETGVTWSSIPSTTTTNRAAIATSTAQWSWNTTVNVTALTQDIWASGTNDGYMLSLQTAAYYRNVLFASSDDANSNLWPELYIEYDVPCNANFTYCSSTPHPNTYNFDAIDPSSCLSYHWDFGDATTGTGPNVVHTYGAPGSYTVCLSLVDDRTGIVYCRECTNICIDRIIDQPGGGGQGMTAPSKHSDDKLVNGKSHFKTDANASGAKSTSAKQGPAMKLTDGSITVLAISPNPTHANLNVDFRLLLNSTVNYKVYDMTGKQVAGEQRQMDKGQQRLSVPVNNLPAGNYMLEMTDGYMQVKQKFTKE